MIRFINIAREGEAPILVNLGNVTAIHERTVRADDGEHIIGTIPGDKVTFISFCAAGTVGSADSMHWESAHVYALLPIEEVIRRMKEEVLTIP